MKEFADAVKTKVSGCFDVIAAGGGVAGISAALAARHGRGHRFSCSNLPIFWEGWPRQDL